jgi:hypothetical protein
LRQLAGKLLREGRPRTRDCHHLGIEVTLGAAELWCPNIACSAQREQRHPGTPRLYHDHALAPTEGEPSEPDDSGLGHCRADHPERLDRDRPALVATPGASEWISRVSSPATNRSGRTLKKGAGNLANSRAALQISLMIR